MPTRRSILAALPALAAAPALAQNPHAHHSGQFERLNQPGRIDTPALHFQHAVTDSPAPKAAQQGAWRVRAPLPIPRTEMAWAVAYKNRMHLCGGYAEQRVDRPYHHAYDPASDRWEELPSLPRGANHVGLATHGTGGDERIFAFGGFIEQNRTRMTRLSPSTAPNGRSFAACPRPAAPWPACPSAGTSTSSAARSARITAVRSTGTSSMM